MRTIGYVRVSTEGQAQDGVSLAAQEAKIRAWAELNEATEVIIYCDAGMSGKRADNRAGLQDALSALAEGDALVVYSLSRLARSTKDTIAIADTLARKGADLVSMSEKIDTTTAAGKMVFRMLAVLNEFERDQVSERTRLALDHKRACGEKTGGKVPFGYSADADGRLTINEKEQDACRLMRRLRKSGHTLQGIIDELDARGIKTRCGGRWYPSVVARIIDAEPRAVAA
jgi:site-specific DNA recombinase